MQDTYEVVLRRRGVYSRKGRLEIYREDKRPQWGYLDVSAEYIFSMKEIQAGPAYWDVLVSSSHSTKVFCAVQSVPGTQ